MVVEYSFPPDSKKVKSKKSLDYSKIIPELCGHEKNELLSDITLRLIETSILSSKEITRIYRLWGTYSGRQRETIRKVLETKGINDSHNDLTDAIYNYLAAERSISRSITNQDKKNTIEAYKSRTKSEQLRCEICGYHFTQNDVSPLVSQIASDCNLVVANFIHPSRFEDDFKPISSDNKDRVFLKLEFDHIIPRSIMGFNLANNLQVCCRFCNLGKSNFVYSLEPIYQLINSSLRFSYPKIEKVEDNKLFSNLATTFVSTVRFHRDKFKAHSFFHEKELTVKFKDDSKIGKNFSPWNLDVVSYE